jgi:hypothetical protein
MALTSTQIINLNNSMSAAQDVALGSVLDALVTSGSIVISGSTVSGYKRIISGSFTPAGPVIPIVTGLSTVLGVVAELSGSPTNIHSKVTATTGSVAGVIWVSSWMVTSASWTPLIAASGSTTAHYALVSWIAYGT